MKDHASKGRPVLFSIMLGMLLTLVVAVSTAVATMVGLEDRGIKIAQGCGFLFMAVIVTVYMKRRDRSLASFGFRKLDLRKEQETLFYIPLLIIAFVQPIIAGFNLELSILDIIIFIILALLVGYTEEVVFRGIIKERLRAKGSVFFILFSSILFGILHMANAFNSDDLLSIVLQVINAFLVGLILALLFVLSHQIIPLILFHFLFDVLAFSASTDIVKVELLSVTILNSLYFLYGIYLVCVLLHKRKKQRTSPLTTLT